MKKIKNISIELYKDKNQLLTLSILGFLTCLLEDSLLSSSDVIHASGAMIAVAAIGVGASVYAGSKNRKAAKEAAEKAEKEKAKQMAALSKEKERYESFEFKNPYENLQTEYENVYEDLTVNQQQAQFQAQQGAQQRSDIMQDLKGAAGGSGIAGLAQAMANQGQLATQQASASIGQQEAANQKLKAQGAGMVQQQEAAAQKQIASGEELVARQEADRRATLLGMQAQMAGGATQASSSADQMQLQTNVDANNAIASSVTSGATGVAGSYNEQQLQQERIDAGAY